MEKYVTHISLADFKKLKLVGWRHVYKNGTSYFESVDLSSLVEEIAAEAKATLVVAIHEEPKRETVEYLKEEGNMCEEDAYDLALYNECYTIPGEGYQTYRIEEVEGHLKSTRDYWEDGKVKINKRVTKNVYEIAL